MAVLDGMRDMSYWGERNTGGQKFISAPYQTGPITTVYITGVWLRDGEDVEWIWTHTPQGSYVSGYTLRSKGIPASKEHNKEMESDDDD